MGIIVFLLVFAGGWAWLAKYWRRRGHGRVLSVAGAGVAAFIVAAILGAYTDGAFKHVPAAAPESAAATPSAPSAVPKAEADTPQQPHHVDAEPSLGMSLDEYVGRFNTVAKQLHSRYRMRPTRKVDEELGAERYTADLTETMTVAGILGSNGEVQTANLVARQTNSDADAAEQMLVVMATLTAASKDASMEDAAPTIRALFREASAQMDTNNGRAMATKTFNGVDFGMARMDGVNMYSAAVAKD